MKISSIKRPKLRDQNYEPCMLQEFRLETTTFRNINVKKRSVREAYMQCLREKHLNISMHELY